MKAQSTGMSILFAIVSGLLTALAFPTRFGALMLPNLGFLAWFSLVPLFVAIYRADVRKTFILTFVTGFVLYFVSLYWIYNALHDYGGFTPAAAVGVMVLMMAILGAYLGLITAMVKLVRSKWNVPVLIMLPVAWVAIELLRNHVPFGGFPWNSIAYSQARYRILIQSADIFGIYGLTFLIILVNQLIASLIVEGAWRERGRLARNTVTVGLIIVMTVLYGWSRSISVVPRSPKNRVVRVALVQGNISQGEKWVDSLLDKNLEVYARYTRLLKDGDADLIVWPESSYPYVVPTEIDHINPESLGLNPDRERPYWLFFGTLSMKGPEADGKMSNSSILIENDGTIDARYDKVHLVPFGEYVPLRKALFFVKKVVAPIGDFVPGEGYEPISVGGAFKIAPLICFEDVFPGISKTFVNEGANLLVNITNDAWYGWTSAAYQHLSMAIFRSVESRRYMLRATNTGISAIIDPRGRLELESGLFTRSFVKADVPILYGLTVYDRIGDLFAYLCMAVLIFFLASIPGLWIYNKVRKGEQ